MNLLRFDELPATPWKNGGGITRELACYPERAGLDDFVWRASVADVAASGPFSNFPGVDRIIMLLGGDGMQLQFAEGAQHALTTPLQPFRFHGESPLHAQLAGTPSQDFNLMLRRELVDGDVHVWRDAIDVTPDDGFVLFHCAAGAWQIADQNLHARDTLIGQLTSATQLRPLQTGSILIGVRIAPRPTFIAKAGHATE
jgi:environmental stress-induced protein Ves